jgi:hypothetical protein
MNATVANSGPAFGQQSTTSIPVTRIIRCLDSCGWTAGGAAADGMNPNVIGSQRTVAR